MDILELLDFFEPPISIGFDVKPEEALEHFYAKGLTKSFTYADLTAAEQASSFTVAKMMDTDMLADVKSSLEKAMESGTPFKQWANEIMPTLEAKGWLGDQANPAWRLETIFRTNMQSAYAVGEWQQIRAQEEIAPFLMYDAVDDFRTRPEHAALDGEIHPVGSTFWKHYHPPNDYNCRCSVIQLSQDELDELGLSVSPPHKIEYYEWRNPKTGKIERVAKGTGPGFDFNPGEERYQQLLKIAQQKAAAMDAASAKAAMEGLAATQQLAAQVAQVEVQAIRQAATLSNASKAVERAAIHQINKAIDEKTPYLSKAIQQVKATATAQEMPASQILAVAKEKAAKAEASATLSNYKQQVLAGKTPNAKQQSVFDALPEEAQASVTAQLNTQLVEIKANKAAADELAQLTENPNSLAGKALAKIDQTGKTPVDVLTAVKEQVAAQKLKQVSAQTIAGYEKALLNGKTPTSAQKIAFESLPKADQQALLKSIEKELEAQFAALAKQSPDVPKAPAGGGVLAPELDTENLVQIGPQKGSNPGGLYQDTTTGTQWYIKQMDVERARNEVLAAKLYEAAGIEVPDLRLTTLNGQPAVASRIIPGLTKGSPIDLAKAADGFLTDAWLGNWDVVGADFDNLLLRNGVPVRVDTGGALRFRAQGTAKGSAFGTKVNEIDTLLDAKKNPRTAAVFGKLTQAQLEAGARKVLNISDEQIRKMVDESGPLDAIERKKLADTLIARKVDIAQRFPNAAPISAELRAQAVEAAQFAAKEGLAAVDGAMVTAIKGIASRATKGAALEAKDIERVAEVRKQLQAWLQEHGPVLSSQGQNTVQGFYAPWLADLDAALATGKWSGGRFGGFKGSVDIDPARVRVSPAAAGVTFTQQTAKSIISNALGSSAANMDVPKRGGAEVLKAVPLEHQRAIAAYTGSYYRAVNEALRTDTASAEVRRYADLLNEALAIAPKYQGTVARGISLDGKELKKFLADHRAAMLDGSSIVHRGFISASMGEHAAFGGNVVLHIQARKGVNVKPISLHPNENEVLLSHGSRFRVLNVEERGGRWHVDLEEVDG